MLGRERADDAESGATPKYALKQMRTIWKGSLSFGLVTIPVGLTVAQQRQDASFRTLHRECGTPIKQKRYCPVHDRDVTPDELVKGW